MHRIAATPGGWSPDTDGLIVVEQTPAPMVFLTAADTELQTLAAAIEGLPVSFPAVRAANLLQLQQQLSIDLYAESVLARAKVIVLRLLGGRSYWPYGLEVCLETVRQTGAHLVVLPGDDRPEPGLMGHSTLPLAMAERVRQYCVEGGVENVRNSLRFLAATCLETGDRPLPPQPVPRVGRYAAPATSDRPRVGVLFYRAHYLAGNTAAIDALCRALAARNLAAVALYVPSLRDPEVQAEVLAALPDVGAIVNTTGFSIAKLDATAPNVGLWEAANVPVLQAILSSGTREQWDAQWRGLSPRDTAMNVALPEVDGRIIGRAIAFKAVRERHPHLETDIVGYAPEPDRVEFVAELAANWVRLQQTPASDRRVALILANYPARNGRLANGVGLDVPASCIEILRALQAAGYGCDRLPVDGDELIAWLTAGRTNDPEGAELKPVGQALSGQAYWYYWQRLPDPVRERLQARWGDPDPAAPWPVAGLQLGNLFIGIQPARGYDLDPNLNYHAPDLEPTHHYLAFYQWVRTEFGAQAIVHVGKHGNLEWLPGKSVALGSNCFPEVALGPLPHLYPFIVNDPGEGTQAKRRAQAVIVDHLTPPLTRAELYGPLLQLEALIDEYYEADSLDPTRLPAIRDRMAALVETASLADDFGTPAGGFADFLSQADRYLCDLKEAQIRDGLHILGRAPAGRLLRDLVAAIARHPGSERLGLTRALARDWNWDFDPLTADPAAPFPGHCDLRTIGKAVEALELQAARLIDAILEIEPTAGPTPGFLPEPAIGPATQQELNWIRQILLPALADTSREIAQLLRGLNGEYVPSGPAGAPTRGRPEVLPTGRNFYAVDPRGLPTESAWDVGRKAAETLIERYAQEHGDYPQTLGLSVWGTATMRTGGDDIAEALALMGVRPVWDGPSRRVTDFEILPVSVLERPRVDVTLRVSGFFRDAFPNLIDLFDAAARAVAALDEAPPSNPLAANVRADTDRWQATGIAPEEARDRASYRVFGSKPGAYGAGLQGLIEAQNWQDDGDLARAYLNWSGYAYGKAGGAPAPAAFERRLEQVQAILHNQDNREHDLLDSDDYYQFQGGMTVAARSLQGRNPALYFGDNARPEQPRVRSLAAEIARVYRSRVVNPKWIAGAMRHGYKGAFEMAATVDYLFAYSATTHCVADFMYAGIAKAYLCDPEVRGFVQARNPWALRDMAERLLEASQRGLWQQPDPELLDVLREIALQAEADIEANL